MATANVKGHKRGGRSVKKHTRKVKAKSFRKLDTSKRTELAAKKEALPDGSFPIANKRDLANAIKAHGMAKNPAKAKAWIKKRAKDLGATSQLPADWT